LQDRKDEDEGDLREEVSETADAVLELGLRRSQP
jgi:hypothetical protein